MNNSLNVNLFHVQELKKAGINFKLSYTLEFTQSEKVAKEVEEVGNYDNVDKKKFDNITDAINSLIQCENSKYPTLYYQLNMQLSINNMIVLEDTMLNTCYTSKEIDLLYKLQDLSKHYNNEIELHQAFLKKFNAEKSFDEFKKVV